MSMPKTMTTWIRLVASVQDRALLEELTRLRDEPGFSTTVRNLIREEAQRHGLATPAQPHDIVAA